jgi:hypothetical protein
MSVEDVGSTKDVLAVGNVEEAGEYDIIVNIVPPIT